MGESIAINVITTARGSGRNEYTVLKVTKDFRSGHPMVEINAHFRPL